MLIRKWPVMIAWAALVASTYPASGASGTAAEQRQLFRDGARLWPVYCSQCHNARPGSEFPPYQWNAIIMHIVRRLICLQKSRAMLEFLKSSH